LLRETQKLGISHGQAVEKWKTGEKGSPASAKRTSNGSRKRRTKSRGVIPRVSTAIKRERRKDSRRRGEGEKVYWFGRLSGPPL